MLSNIFFYLQIPAKKYKMLRKTNCLFSYFIMQLINLLIFDLIFCHNNKNDFYKMSGRLIFKQINFQMRSYPFLPKLN